MVVTGAQREWLGHRASPGSRGRVGSRGQQPTRPQSQGQTFWQPTAEQDSLVVAQPRQGRPEVEEDRLVRIVLRLVPPAQVVAA